MKLLVIEDSERLARALVVGLRKLGHAVDVASDGRDGLDFAKVQDYDVIVLDIMLPGMDGFALLSELRRVGRQTHVLILSARDRVEDRIRGLQCGADDYLTKPFSFEELCARLNALGRRSFNVKNPEIDLGSVRLNTASREVFGENGPLDLTPGEYAVMERLAVNRGRILTKEQLLAAVHGSDVRGGLNVIEVMICNLRRKLGDAKAQALIQTRRGLGYLIP